MPKTFGRMTFRESKIATRASNPFIYLSGEEPISLVFDPLLDSNTYKTFVHWIQNNGRWMKINCTGKSGCPGCADRQPQTRFITYAYQVDEDRVGMIELNQPQYHSLSGCVTSYALNLDDLPVFILVKEQRVGRFKTYQLTPTTRTIIEEERSKIKGLFTAFRNSYQLETFGAPATEEEWEARLAGKSFNRKFHYEDKNIKKKISRFAAIGGKL